MLALLNTVLLAGFAGIGAWLDWRDRRLPNWLCGLALACGLGLASAAGGVSTVIPHLEHAGLALVVGTGLFAGGLIGGGDAKYYAALAAWFPLAEGFRLLLLVALAGLVLTSGLWALVWRQGARARAGAGAAALTQPQTVPYGVAIAAGAMIAQVW